MKKVPDLYGKRERQKEMSRHCLSVLVARNLRQSFSTRLSSSLSFSISPMMYFIIVLKFSSSTPTNQEESSRILISSNLSQSR